MPSFFKSRYIIGGVLILLILLGVGLSIFIFNLQKNPQNVSQKTGEKVSQTRDLTQNIYLSFAPEKADELSGLIKEANQTSDSVLKYSLLESVWNRMLAVYYSSGRKPEQRVVLEQLKEDLKKYTIYEEKNFVID